MVVVDDVKSCASDLLFVLLCEVGPYVVAVLVLLDVFSIIMGSFCNNILYKIIVVVAFFYWI